MCVCHIQGICSELIYYDREESAGPKLSNYSKCRVPECMDDILKNALGLWGQVKKMRTLIMIGQTRVHFDSVEGLGDFVELEVSLSFATIKYTIHKLYLCKSSYLFFVLFQVVLNKNQIVEDGQKIAMELMSHMGVEKEDLVPVSYISLLCQKNKSMS